MVGTNRDSEPMSDSIACCERLQRLVTACAIRSAATDHDELMTYSRWSAAEFVDGGRRRRIVYDKKPQRYAEDNKTSFICTQ